MEYIEMIGLGLGLIIGLILGLLGGGGSILIMPVLVYIFQFTPADATAHSLLAVGCGALVGTVGSTKNAQVNWKTGAIFAMPSMLAVYAVQRWGIQAIPSSSLIAGYHLTRDMLIMGTFALLMITAAFSMIRRNKNRSPKLQGSHRWWIIATEGFIVGALTGLVGAGGGFLIVPALVIFLGMRMETAIGTSLFIISLKSLVGFFGAIGSGAVINWALILPFVGLTVVGCYVGTRFRVHIRGVVLKQIFGWLILIMGLIILKTELN